MDERMMRSIVHIKVYLVGRCSSCNAYNEVLSHDYGRTTYKQTEDAMDEVEHYIRDIHCKQCGFVYPPSDRLHRDMVSGTEVVREKINYGTLRQSEDNAKWMAAHDQRKEEFARHADEFWANYIAYALEDWRAAVNELTRAEVEAAYKQLGIVAVSLRTDQQARKDAINRFTADQERSNFWRVANDYFIREELLEIGPVGWTPSAYAKMYGLRRTQFAILHFPVVELHEPERTKAVAQLFRRDRGDNAFLLRRIAALNDQVEAANERTTAYFHAVEKARAEVAEAQRKLATAYEQIRSLEERQPAAMGEPADKRKVRELKSFVAELMAELRQLRQLRPTSTEGDEEANTPAELEEDNEQPALPNLEGKTVAIIGGWRSVDKDYPCRIITHNGDRVDVDLLAALKEADYIAVLTRFISHAAMWEAKAYAISNDVPIAYCPEINIGRILDTIAKTATHNG